MLKINFSKMTNFVSGTVGIIFCLPFLSVPCEGKVNLPPGGDTFVVASGTARVEIAWTFDDKITATTIRQWRFNSEQLASSFGNNKPVKQSSSLPEFDIESNATLVLKNVDNRYNGTYVFIISEGFNVVYASEVTVFITVRPNVTINCSSTIRVDERDSVRCLCEGKGGYPLAHVTWYDKDGEMIGDVGNEEKMLTLNHVNETNNGTYKCVAQSYNLQAKESIKVIVQVKPTVTSLTFSPKIAHIGESVTIECKASGYPAPSYTITLNDKLVLSNQMMYEFTNLNTSHVGSIITCTAANYLGNDSRSERLPLKVSPTTMPTTTGTKTDNKTDKTGDGGIGVGVIVGIVIGVLVLLVVVIVLAWWCKNKEKDGHSGNVIMCSSNNDPVNLYESVNDGPKAGGDDAGGSTSGSPPANANPPVVYAAVDKTGIMNRKAFWMDNRT